MKLSSRLCAAAIALAAISQSFAQTPYTPAPENLANREKFANDRFGIFIHWGIYSMFGQGEWYLNYGANRDEYAKAAQGFYPANFNAAEWVKTFKDAGARYICITSRHHDGFSMWDTDQSDYNIVDATPFKRDILKELSEECQKQGLDLHFYYSHIDWTRDDYPMGRTGRTTGKDPEKADWDGYYNFMNNQLTELLTNYGPVRAIWFDGKWDRDQDPEPFDWELEKQYALIHSIQPGCLIGNNHHEATFPGEDIQIFERDLPGENKAGYSGQAISRLPLETCETMNGMWGYKIMDQNYKSVKDLIHLLVGAAGKGANLLLNVGPQPSGDIPAAAVERLRGMGQWLDKYGDTVYGTEAGDFPAQAWGVSTRKGNKLFAHILTPESKEIFIPVEKEVKSAATYEGRQPVKFSKVDGGVMLELDDIPSDIDYIVEFETI